MIKTIFLDMDGVLADFVGGVCRAFDRNNPYPEETRDYSFWHAWPGIDFKHVNAICNQAFWHKLDWMYDGRDTLRAIVETVGLEKVYLSTMPMPNLETPTGKMMWIHDNLPIYLDRTIISTRNVPKSFLAKPGALLIDDKDENIVEFIAAGGQGILVPRPWNREFKNSDISSKVVREHLEALC